MYWTGYFKTLKFKRISFLKFTSLQQYILKDPLKPYLKDTVIEHISQEFLQGFYNRKQS